MSKVKLTGKEILDRVEKIMSVTDFAYWESDKFEDINENYIKDKCTLEEAEAIVEELGEVEEVDQYGGEGQGETWYSVKLFKDHGVYIRIDGYYESYNGVEFDQGYGEVVEPKQKTITVYE